MSVSEEVKAALDHEPVAARDRATATLALTYAAAIDDGADLSKLGPALLACLESLLMSPRARAAAKKAVITSEPAANPLDALAERRSRKSRAEDLDATAT
jgi:hypothetical protein